MKAFKLLFILILSNHAFCQIDTTKTINVAEIKYFDLIGDKCFIFHAKKKTTKEENIPFLNYIKKDSTNKNIARLGIENEILFKFVIFNNTSYVKQYYFIPGYFLESFDLYQSTNGNKLSYLTGDSLSKALNTNAKLISIKPSSLVTVFGKVSFARTNTNSFSPKLIEKDFLGAWTLVSNNSNQGINKAGYIFIGMMMLMIIYSIILYTQNRNSQFLLYSAYVFCNAILILLKIQPDYLSGRTILFFEEYLDFAILCISTLLYLFFMKRIINPDTKKNILITGIYIGSTIMILCFSTYSFFYLFTEKYNILNILENYIIKVVIFLLSIFVIINGIRKRNKFVNYIVLGNISLVIFSLLSFFMLILDWDPFPMDKNSVLNRSLFYYELGLSIELQLFLFGLAYKNKIDIITKTKEHQQFKMDAERKEFDRQLEIIKAKQHERDRISADLHDDLGSGVTAIRLMSEILKTKIQDQSFPEIERISNSANEIINSMNAIIWATKSSNDSAESLVAYLKAYAYEYFDSTPIKCAVSVNIENILNKELDGTVRRNIFLCFKEALTNALKHSEATEIKIAIYAEASELVIKVQDNGKGIKTKSKKSSGNGIINMQKRIESINGKVTFEFDEYMTITFKINVL